MCGIPTSLASSDAPVPTRPTVTVNYDKTLSQVYQDIIVYMLQSNLISETFNFRTPCSQAIAGLPSWALAWQHDLCSQDETRAIKQAISDHDTTFGHLTTWCPLSPDTRLTDPFGPTYGSRNPPYKLPPFLAPADQRKWEIPRPLGDGTLELPARVLDYVAEVTNHTCNVEWLLSRVRDAEMLRRPYILGSAPRRLRQCKRKRPFNPGHDHRRLAIMRTPASTHIALVPADTEEGNFLVAVAPDILPLILSPYKHLSFYFLSVRKGLLILTYILLYKILIFNILLLNKLKYLTINP